MDNKTVLIIEDDVLHMKLFSDVLENLGYTTLRAYDGEVAMDLVRENQPDLIILDIRFPFTSGFEIIKWLKNEDGLKNVPIIAVTAMANNMAKDDYLRHGFDDFLAKPIAIPNFIKTVADFCVPAPCLVH